jgi:hypothetical protein
VTPLDPVLMDNVDMASLADIVVDCAHPASLARFWSGVLDDYSVAPYDDDAELARLRSLGIDDVEDDPIVLVEPASGRGPRLWFQRVPEPKRVKNRVHVDLRTDDFDAELARLIELGARSTLTDPGMLPGSTRSLRDACSVFLVGVRCDGDGRRRRLGCSATRARRCS